MWVATHWETILTYIVIFCTTTVSVDSFYSCCNRLLYCLFTSVLRECKNVELSFSDFTCKTDLLKGTKKGTVYLTPYRVQARITKIFPFRNIAAAVYCGKLAVYFLCILL